MGVFRWDSPFWQAITVCTYYVLLNIICLIFSIPIITAGAAISAKYYVGMKLARGEDIYLLKDYVKAFKMNFKQATKIWIVQLVFGLLIAYDWFIVLKGNPDSYDWKFFLVLLGLSIIFLMISLSSYGLMARFEMKTFDLIKGSITFTIIRFPIMLFAVFILISPFLLSAWHMEWLIPILPLGVAVSLYIISSIFVKNFKEVEERVASEHVDEAKENNNETVEEDDEEKIFSDELDESLSDNDI